MRVAEESLNVCQDVDDVDVHHLQLMFDPSAF
jgi:hypothetical protein